jgi:hypothetical protein
MPQGEYTRKGIISGETLIADSGAFCDIALVRVPLIKTLPALALIAAGVCLVAQAAQAASLVWQGAGSSSDLLTASNWSPAKIPEDHDSFVFSSTTANLAPIADIGDVDLTEISFLTSGYVITGRNSQDEICSRSVYASQASYGVEFNCRFRTNFANATLTCVNSGATLSFDNFELDGGFTVTVAGKGETVINNLTTPSSTSSPTAINQTGPGILVLTGKNTASYTTITVSAGTLQVSQTSASGNTNTVIGVKGTLTGGGISGAISNQGTLAPGAGALTINSKLTCPLDTSNPSYVSFSINGASSGLYSSLIVDGGADFSGSYLKIGFGGNYLPAIGDSFTLCSLQGASYVPAIPFRGSPEGSLYQINRYFLSITYKGGSSGKDVVVTRVPTPSPAFGPLSRDAQGVINLPIKGFSGEVVQVESSPDLKNWTAVQMLTLDSSATANFTEPTSTVKIFFRVIAVDP